MGPKEALWSQTLPLFMLTGHVLGSASIYRTLGGLAIWLVTKTAHVFKCTCLLGHAGRYWLLA